MIDPQINPTIVVPVVIALVVLLVLLLWRRADGRLQWGVAILIAFVIVFFLISRTPIF